VAVLLVGIAVYWLSKPNEKEVACNTQLASAAEKLAAGDAVGARGRTVLALASCSADSRSRAAELQAAVDKALVAHANCEKGLRRAESLVGDHRLQSARTAMDQLDTACADTSQAKTLRLQIDAGQTAAASAEADTRQKLARGDAKGARLSLEQLNAANREHLEISALRTEIQNAKAQDAAAAPVAAAQAIQFDPQLKQMLIAASKHQWEIVDSATAAPLALRNANRDRAAGRAANAEGKSALQRGENQAAIEAFTRGVKADAVDPEIVNNLAYAYQESGAHAEAIGALNETLLLAPRRVAAWANLSASLAETGDRAASAAALSLALHFSGSRQKTLMFLGEQAQNGRSDAARAVASAVLSAADEIPTLGDNVTTARADVPGRAMSSRPARTDEPASQIKAEEAYSKQMNRQLEQQLRELSQK
jgi:Flp pilus assembly protein TadD